MIRLLLLLSLLAPAAYAETARVYSGDHPDFTRLVIELPAGVDWTVGRTATGYAFATRSADRTDFDLGAVWQRISRTRLKGLSNDPVSGMLDLELGCDCHVFPFEYRPGTVVLDIKPGPPPAGSAFETDIAGQLADASDSPAGPPAAAYNWLARPAGPKAGSSMPTLPLPLDTGAVSLEPLRDALLQQIAQGAADGVVDMGMPSPKHGTEASAPDVLPWTSLRIGEQPGIRVDDPDAFVAGMVPASPCAADDLLDLASWGQDVSPLDLLARARSGLYGEFDAPDPTAVVQSVRLHLYLGFGAEAVQQADLVTDNTEEETLALYRSMARILDGESDPGTPFANMLDCDGPAALWAALARDRLPAGPGVNRDAILRAFTALPPHLRGHLGATLAEKFLEHDDPDAARVVRDAMERAPQIDPAAVALLDAESDLHQGDVTGARTHAEAAVALDGNGAEGLVALVEAHFRQLEPIGPEVSADLLALAGEVRGTDIAAAVDRATILAQALSGQTEAAFSHPAAAGNTLGDLWQVVHERATDDDFLRHAVLPDDASVPDLPADLDLAIAKRLLALGFPDAALAWIGPVPPTDAPDQRLAAAEAEFGRGNARAAVDLLVGATGAEAATLRAKALLQLGDLPAAETALAAAGEVEAALRTDLWQGNWANLDPATPEAWQTAARQAGPLSTDAATGLLGRGAQAIDSSIAARKAIDALLISVSPPDGVANVGG